VAHSVEGNIVLDLKVVHAVSGDGTIVRVMNSIALDKRAMHSANHVEVNGVAAELEGLTGLSELDVVDTSLRTLITWRVNNNVRAEQVLLRVSGVPSEHHVSGEETDFCLHGHLNTAVGWYLTNVLVHKSFSQSNGGAIDRFDVALFVVIVEMPGGTSNDDMVADIPVGFTLDSDGGVSCLGSNTQSSPGGSLRNTVHAQHAVSAANHLVSVDAEGGAEAGGVHSDLHLGSVREFLCSKFEVTMVHHDEISIESAEVVGVGVGSKDHATFNDNSVKFRG